MRFIELTMQSSGTKVSVNPSKIEYIIDEPEKGSTVVTGSFLPVTERRSVIVAKIRHATDG